MNNKLLPNTSEINLINSLSANCIDKYQIYVDYVLEKNRQHNFIGKTTTTNIWSRHIIDSLQLIEYIDDTCENILDLGSGAGFPAIVLGVATKKRIILVEKSNVKAKFLNDACKMLDLKFEIINTTINNNNIQKYIHKNTIITSRAFKCMYDILLLLENNTANIVKVLLLKGENIQNEIDNCRVKDNNILNKWNIDIHNSILEKGYIVECNIKNKSISN